LEADAPRSKENLELRVLIVARLSTAKSPPGNKVSGITGRYVPGSQMHDVTESLMMLCEQASKEQDFEKLSNLVDEIIQLLAEKQRLEWIRSGMYPA
jgi:aspartokinase